MKSKFTLLLFVLFFSIPTSYTQTDPRLEGLDEELEKVLSTWSAVGFGVAVVEKDEVVYAKGFGYRDLENKLPATENTLFAIGSCTKAFTTAVLGKLEAEQKLSFDASPKDYVPFLRFSTDQLNEMVTVRDMISHRTGIPRHDLSWYLFPSDNKDSLLMRVAHQEPFSGLRQNWYYNNFMYLAQGVIAEKVSGKSWEDNIRAYFFDPLGMETSNLHIPELEESEEASFGYELNYGEIEKMDYYRIRGMAPAGSINSSVREMANWLITWINGGSFEGKEILPQSYVQQAISSQMVISGRLPGNENPGLHMNNYGFGWFLSSYNGHYRVEHGGNIDGFSANTCFFPSDSIGIVVLVNQNGSSVPSVVRNLIADRMLELDRFDWNSYLKKMADESATGQKEAIAAFYSSKKPGTTPSHKLAGYTGVYSNPGYGSIEIRLSGDSLVSFVGDDKLWLRHFHYDLFEPLDLSDGELDTIVQVDLRMNFRTNKQGEVTGFDAQFEPALDHPIHFTRKPIEVEMEEGELDKYVGEFELAGQVSKFYTKEDGMLYLFVQGQPEYELMATGEHNFTLKVLDGYTVQFQETENGYMEAVLFIQPNGTFRATRKN